MMLCVLASSPLALRVAPPVMQLRTGVRQQVPMGQQVAPVGPAPASGFTSNVVPTSAGKPTLQQKVETMRDQLNLASGQTLAQTIAKGVEAIGLEEEVKSLNMLQTVDACLQMIGAAPATALAGAAAATEEEQAQAQNGALVRGPWRPPPLGLGDSYEGAMFGDYGYGGFGGYSPYGYSYGRGGLGWGGYGRDSPWDVAYGGLSSYGASRPGGRYGYSGYSSSMSGYGYGSVGYGYGSSRGLGGYGGSMCSSYSSGSFGGYGSWGANSGHGGLRFGSAAERAVARSDVRAAMPDGRMTGDGRM